MGKGCLCFVHEILVHWSVAFQDEELMSLGSRCGERAEYNATFKAKGCLWLVR